MRSPLGSPLRGPRRDDMTAAESRREQTSHSSLVPHTHTALGSTRGAWNRVTNNGTKPTTRCRNVKTATLMDGDFTQTRHAGSLGAAHTRARVATLAVCRRVHGVIPLMPSTCRAFRIVSCNKHAHSVSIPRDARRALPPSPPSPHAHRPPPPPLHQQPSTLPASPAALTWRSRRQTRRADSWRRRPAWAATRTGRWR